MGQDSTPVYDPEKAQALYLKSGQQAIPQTGLALVVLGDHDCGHCQRSMAKTNYTEQAAGGTPVAWVDLYDANSARGLGGFGGITQDAAGKLAFAGQAFQGMPTTIIVKDGVVVGVAKVGEIESQKEFDLMASAAQARFGASLGGSTVPNAHAAPAKTASQQR